MSDTVEQPTAVEEKLYEYQPTDEQGVAMGSKQIIKYTTDQELIDKLAKNHIESMRGAYKLRQQALNPPAKEDDGIEKASYTGQDFKPRQLTADELWLIQNDPSSPEARKLIIESELGASPEAIRGLFTEVNKDVLQLRAKQEAEAFLSEHPEFPLTPKNGSILTNFVGERGWKPTKANFERAYKMLADALLLEPAPTVTEVTQANPLPETAPTAPIAAPEQVTTRPVPTSSGLNRHNSSPTGTPVRAQAKWTVDQVNKMSGTEYERHFNGTEAVAFRKFVDENSAHLT